MIPDAVAAVIAAVMAEHPAASPQTLARLVVRELDALGWRVVPARTTPHAAAQASRRRPDAA